MSKLKDDILVIEHGVEHFFKNLEKFFENDFEKADAFAVAFVQEIKAALASEAVGDVLESIELKYTGKVHPEWIALAKNALDRVALTLLALQAYPSTGTAQEKSDWLTSVLKALGLNPQDRIFSILSTDIAQQIGNFIDTGTEKPTYAQKMAALDNIYLTVKPYLS